MEDGFLVVVFIVVSLIAIPFSTFVLLSDTFVLQETIVELCRDPGQFQYGKLIVKCQVLGES